MKNNNDIDKIFKDALDDLHETAPPAVWESLNNDLNRQQAVHFREKYYRLKRWALLLLLFIFSGSVYLFLSYATGKKYAASEQKNISMPVSGKKQTTESVAATEKSVSKESKVTRKQQDVQQQPDNASPASANIKTLPAAAVARDESGKEKTATEKVQQNSSSKQETIAAATIKKTQPVSSSVKDEVNKENLAAGKQPSAKPYHQYTLLPAVKNDKQVAHIVKNTKDNKAIPAENIAQYAKDNYENKLIKEKNSGMASAAEINRTANESDSKQPKSRGPQLLSVVQQNPFLAVIEPTAPYTDYHPWILSDSARENVKLKTAQKAAALKTAPFSRFSLSVFIAPNHSFTRLEDDKQLSGPGQDKKEAEKAEQQGKSYSAGLLLNYSLTKKWIIQSGIEFSSATTNIAGKTIYAKPDNNGHAQYEFNCSSGYSFITPKSGNPPAVGDSIRIMASSSTINYVAVPLSLNYVVQTGRLLLKPGIGLSLNFLTSGNSATNFGNMAGNQKVTTSITGLKSSYLDASIGFGAEYMFSRRISIGLRPLMRLALTSINKNTPVKSYQNYMSLEAGLKINL